MDDPVPPKSSSGKKWFWGIVFVFILFLVAFYSGVFEAKKEPLVVPAPYDANSQCAGDWVFKQREVCDDPNQPMYATVTDGERCGWTTETRTIQPSGYRSCRDSSHGVERYRFSDTVDRTSGWNPAGKDQAWWCQEMKTAYAKTKPGASLVWLDETSSEESKKDSLGNVTYKYHCSAVANWDPIYKLQESAACGPKEPVQRTQREPKTCVDETNVVGYERTQNSSCELSESFSVEPNSESRAVFALFQGGMLDGPPRCSTCDEFTGNASQRAECLLERLAEFESGGALQQSPQVKGPMQSVAEELLSSGRPMSEEIRNRLDASF